MTLLYHAHMFTNTVSRESLSK